MEYNEYLKKALEKTQKKYVRPCQRTAEGRNVESTLRGIQRLIQRRGLRPWEPNVAD